MKEKLQQLYDLKMHIESKSFQDNIMKPLYEELDKQKYAYQCQSLRELAEVNGKRKGLMFIIKLLKQIETDVKNTKNELDSQQD